MIPVLYGADETAFTSNGLGQLFDAISCKVTEERNGTYELEMEYPVSGLHFSDIDYVRKIYAKPSDNHDPQPFNIYSISKPIGGICKIRAEHISYQMSHIPIAPDGDTYTSPSAALQGIKNAAVEACPFTFWTDKTSTGNFTITEPQSMRSKLGGTKGSILDVYGGEYEWDGYTVKLWQSRGADNGVTLRYGKNITDIEQEKNIADTITGVMPYWKGTVDNAEVVMTLSGTKVVYSDNASNFPYHRTIILDLSSEFQERPTETQLRSAAEEYVSQTGVGVPKVSITVKFLPLWQSEEYKSLAQNFEHVNLCDTVTVEFPKLEITASAKVVKTVYNVLTERYDEIELGDSRTKLSDAVKADIAAARANTEAAIRKASDSVKSVLRQEMEDAIGQIQLGDDGYIVFDYDESTNRRTQILAMDTEDISTATEILQINHAGIGGYSNGIDDSSGYTLAITTDGKINAEAINTGTLLAALVMASTLTVGGTTNGDGSIYVKNSSGTTIISLNKNGFRLRDANGNVIIAMDDSNGFRLYDADGNRLGTFNASGVNILQGAISGSTFDVKDNGKINLYNSSDEQIGYIDAEGFKSNAESGNWWVGTYYDLALLYGTGLDLGPDRRIFFAPKPDDNAWSTDSSKRRSIKIDRTGIRFYSSDVHFNLTEAGGFIFNNIEANALGNYTLSVATLWANTLRIQANTLRVVVQEVPEDEIEPQWTTYNAITRDITVDGKTLKFRNGILCGVT